MEEESFDVPRTGLLDGGHCTVKKAVAFLCHTRYISRSQQIEYDKYPQRQHLLSQTSMGVVCKDKGRDWRWVFVFDYGKSSVLHATLVTLAADTHQPLFLLIALWWAFVDDIERVCFKIMHGKGRVWANVLRQCYCLPISGQWFPQPRVAQNQSPQPLPRQASPLSWCGLTTCVSSTWKPGTPS